MRPIPQTAVEFVAAHEGVRLTAYRDATGTATIGFGSTRGVAMGMVITLDQAKARLAMDLDEAVGRVDACLDHAQGVIDDMSDNQYAALLSFVFNVGGDPKWTIWKVIKARRFGDVPAQLERFVFSKGQRLPGLVKRRADEAALWASTLPDKPPVPVIGPTAPAIAVLAPAAILAAHAHSPILPIVLGVSLALAIAWVVLLLIKSRNHTMSTTPEGDALVASIDTLANAIKTADANANGATIAAKQAEVDQANAATAQAQADLATEKQNHADDLAAANARIAALTLATGQ